MFKLPHNCTHLTHQQDQSSSVQLLSRVQLSGSLRTAACQAPCPSSIPGVYSNSCLLIISDAIQPPPSLSSLSPPILNLSQHQGLLRESVFWIRWPKYWGFSITISPSNAYSRLISFRMDWLDFLAVQGTFKSLLQHHSSKASSFQCSALFIVQLSHPYMTTENTIAL